MKNILILSPMPTDATSFYRGIGPMAELRRARKDLALTFVQEVNWSTLAMNDCVYMQRPFTASHAKIAELAIANRIPLWVDYDDDLFSVPDWNPCHATYQSEAVQKNIAFIIASASVVSVSTPALATKLRPLNNNCVVVPNAFNERLFGPEVQFPDPADRSLIFWRGSKTHRLDLNVIAHTCVELSREYPHMTWFFLGDAPWFTDFMPHANVRCAEPVDPIEYIDLLRRIRPTIMLVPLHDCPFNRSKSNIAWIEATFATAATIAPAWPEWDRPGVINYSDPDDFRSHLRDAIIGREELWNKNMESWHYINECLTLSVVNQKRLAILEELGI